MVQQLLRAAVTTVTMRHDGGKGAVSDRGRGGLLPPGQRGHDEVLLTLT